jgi:hypothetical protein
MTPTLSAARRVDAAPSLDDRCDRCGASAKLRFELTAGGTLSLCGHHANRYFEEIIRTAAQVVVEDGFNWRGLPTSLTADQPQG